MSGIASPPDNLAIAPSGISHGGYRVAVAVPELASAQCGIGRTGTVVFNSSGAGETWRSIRDAVSMFVPGS
jgi:hypothetical protein